MDAIEDKYWDLMTKSLSGNLDADEEQELEAWLASHPDNENHLRELREIWSQSGHYKKAFQPDKQQAWRNITSTLELQGAERKIAPVRRISILYKVAAIAILILSIWMFQRYSATPEWVEIATIEKAQEIQLPDGTKIWLNPNSNLRYIEKMQMEKERKVELSGIAFFEVAHDPQKPFLIQAQKTETRVLGTSFNVDAREENDIVKVSVITGKVQFNDAKDDNRKIILEAGAEGVFRKSDHSLQKDAVKNSNFLFWKTRKLDFSNTTLQEVVKELGDKYGVAFVIDDPRLSNKRITTTFENQSISEIIKELEVLLDATISNNGKTYTIQ